MRQKEKGTEKGDTIVFNECDIQYAPVSLPLLLLLLFLLLVLVAYFERQCLVLGIQATARPIQYVIVKLNNNNSSSSNTKHKNILRRKHLWSSRQHSLSLVLLICGHR